MWLLPLGGSVWTVKYYWTSGRGETTGGPPFPRARSGVIWPSPRPESPKSNKMLRVGCTMAFLKSIFWPKSCHSKLARTFFVDHLWANGFQCQLDQDQNFQLACSNDRCHYVRLRNRLLRNSENRKKWKSFKVSYGKRMSSGVTKTPPKYSLMSSIVHGHEVLPIVNPH